MRSGFLRTKQWGRQYDGAHPMNFLLNDINLTSAFPGYFTNFAGLNTLRR
jgi:hypothetical protein